MNVQLNLTSTNTASTSLDSASSATLKRAEPADSEARLFERLFAREGDKSDANAPSNDDHERARTFGDERERSQWQTQVDAAVIAASVRPEPLVESRLAEPMSPAPLDELIAKYIQQLAVSEPSALADRRIMLKLDPVLLPDTELFLARSPQGWVLQAASRSPEAVRLIAEHTTALERRFIQRGLGVLHVETVLQERSG